MLPNVNRNLGSYGNLMWFIWSEEIEKEKKGQLAQERDQSDMTP
jgi:hypothetical protein